MSTWGDDIEAAIKKGDERVLQNATFAFLKACDSEERFIVACAMLCSMDFEALCRFWNLPVMNPSRRKKEVVQ